MVEKYIKIKDKEIPINIKSYKTSKSVKIFFKGNILNVTKPTRLSIKNLMEILKESENDIYNKYQKILSSEITTIKQWKTGDVFHYRGKELTVIREYQDKQQISLMIEEEQLKIVLPRNIEEYEIKPNVDNAIKKILKINTEAVISAKLPYWSNMTGQYYNSVKVRDAISRYGSCMPSKKNLYFSSRLVMLPDDKIDAIIVHELCHMVYKNHSKQFYEMVEKYIPNYKEIDKWLKENGKIIMF